MEKSPQQLFSISWNVLYTAFTSVQLYTMDQSTSFNFSLNFCIFLAENNRTKGTVTRHSDFSLGCLRYSLLMSCSVERISLNYTIAFYVLVFAVCFTYLSM